MKYNRINDKHIIRKFFLYTMYMYVIYSENFTADEYIQKRQFSHFDKNEIISNLRGYCTVPPRCNSL